MLEYCQSLKERRMVINYILVNNYFRYFFLRTSISLLLQNGISQLRGKEKMW
jgi:uncharacterized protein YlxP (DUF503 family)